MPFSPPPHDNDNKSLLLSAFIAPLLRNYYFIMFSFTATYLLISIPTTLLANAKTKGEESPVLQRNATRSSFGKDFPLVIEILVDNRVAGPTGKNRKKASKR